MDSTSFKKILVTSAANTFRGITTLCEGRKKCLGPAAGCQLALFRWERLFEKKGLRGGAFLQNVGKIKIHAQCVDFYLGEYYEEKRNKRKCQKVSFIGPKGPACWPLPAQKQENCWSAPPALPVFRPQKRANSCSIFRKRTDEEKI